MLQNIFTARKRSLRRLCFYRCLSVHTRGGACVVLFGGVRGFIWGGMCGFIQGACVVLFGGACMVLFGGHVWFYLGGMRGFIWGVCVVLFGGVCGFFSFFGYNEIRSMSGRYASYWNAFLLYHEVHIWWPSDRVS